MTSTDPPASEASLERLERRMQRAGHRYRATDGERTAALTELKGAIGEADGHFSVHRAAELTGLPVDLLKAIQPDLRQPGRTSEGR